MIAETSNTVFEIGYGDELNGVGFRYEFDGYQATATSRAICGSVKSSGLNISDLPGFEWSADNGLTAKTVSSTTLATPDPVLAIRVKDTFNSLPNRSLVVPERLTVLTDNPIYLRVYLRPTLTGGAWADLNATHSGIEINTTMTAVSSNAFTTIPYSDYFASGRNNAVPFQKLLGKIIMSLGNLGAGTGDILCIAAYKDSASNAAVKVSLGGKEVR